MLEQVRTVTLKCPSCGADLAISANMTQFACGYCGSSQQVIRSGGTVVLQPIVEAVARVQIGTDKTAAELALQRQTKELAKLEADRRTFDEGMKRKIHLHKQSAANKASNSLILQVTGLMILWPILTIFLWAAFPNGWSWLLSTLACLVLFLYGRHRTAGKEEQRLTGHLQLELDRGLDAYDQHILRLSKQIEKNRKIADS